MLNLYIEEVARSFEHDRIRATREAEQYGALVAMSPISSRHAVSLRCRAARMLVRVGFDLDPFAASTAAYPRLLQAS